MLSILHSYLKNVEYQQWLSLVHCQLLYEAILAEWDGSQSRESSAAACTITPLTGRLSLFIFPLLHLEQPGALLPRERPPPESRRESRMLPMGLPGPADSQLLKVCLTKGLRSNGTSQSSVSVLNFLSRVGGGLWGEEREGGHSEGGCRDLRVFSVMANMVVHLSDARQQSSSEHTTCCLVARVWNFKSHLNLHATPTNLPTTPEAPAGRNGEQFVTSVSASAVDQSESSRPDNSRLAPLCCCQPGEQSDLEWLQHSAERLARSAHVSVSEALSCRRALLWSTCTNRRLHVWVKHDGHNYRIIKKSFSWPVSPISNIFLLQQNYNHFP